MKAADRYRKRQGSPRAISAGRWLQRLLVQIARQARANADRVSRWPETSIHSLRKRMKKLQSLIRLGRSALSDRALKSVRARIREIKSTAGSRRDADVLMEVGRDLGIALKPDMPPQPNAKKLGVLVRRLVSSLERIDLSALQWDDVAGNHLKTCRRTRKAWKEAQRKPSVKTLHEWRMRVKDHYHQSIALHRWLGQTQRVRRIRRLGSQLGDCHDLDLFAATIDSKDGSADKKACRKIGRRRKKLTRRIFRKAEKIYSPPLSKAKRRVTTRIAHGPKVVRS